MPALHLPTWSLDTNRRPALHVQVTMGTPTRAMPPMVRAGSVTWAEKLEQSCNSTHSPHHSSSHIRRTCLKQVRNNNRVVHMCVCQWPK